jgi:hypothetical protein
MMIVMTLAVGRIAPTFRTGMVFMDLPPLLRLGCGADRAAALLRRAGVAPADTAGRSVGAAAAQAGEAGSISLREPTVAVAATEEQAVPRASTLDR